MPSIKAGNAGDRQVNKQNSCIKDKLPARWEWLLQHIAREYANKAILIQYLFHEKLSSISFTLRSFHNFVGERLT